MDTSKYCESRFITAEDLKGRRVTVTIEGVKEELLKERNGREVAKPILFFCRKYWRAREKNETPIDTL